MKRILYALMVITMRGRVKDDPGPKLSSPVAMVQGPMLVDRGNSSFGKCLAS